jgi:hypothetical protein
LLHLRLLRQLFQHLDVSLGVHPMLANVHGVRGLWHIGGRSARGCSRGAVLELNLVGAVPALRRLGGHGLPGGGHHLEGEVLVCDEHLVGGQVLGPGQLLLSFPTKLLMAPPAAVDGEDCGWVALGRVVVLLRGGPLRALHMLEGFGILPFLLPVQAVLDADGVALVVATLLDIALGERLLQGSVNARKVVGWWLLDAERVLLVVSGDIVHRLRARVGAPRPTGLHPENLARRGVLVRVRLLRILARV